MAGPQRKGGCPECGRLIGTIDARLGPFTVPRLAPHTLAPHVPCKGSGRIPRNGGTEPVPSPEGAPA